MPQYMPLGSMCGWFVRLATMTTHPHQWVPPGSHSWPTVVWYFEVELQVFLVLCLLSVIHSSKPRITECACVCVYAWMFSVALEKSSCQGGHYFMSFYYNCLPSAVGLFLLEQAIQNSASFSALLRRRAVACTITLLLCLPLSFVFADWFEHQTWWTPNVSESCIKPVEHDIRAMLAGLPWKVCLLILTHMELRVPDSVEQMLCFLSQISMSLNLCHRLVRDGFKAHFPAWKARFVEPRGIVEDHICFVLPLLTTNIALATLAYTVCDKPWTALARKVEQRPHVCALIACAYVLVCFLVWWKESYMLWGAS